MEYYEVVVTRKGQVTIPVRLRRKYGVDVGSRLIAIDTGEGVLLKPAVTTVDLAGSGSKHATVEEMKEMLDRLRSEDV